MVETISPVVHEGRRARYAFAVIIHVLAAGLSAAAVGFILGLIGRLLAAPWGEPGFFAVGLVALAYGGGALGLSVPIPDRHRQVPDWWRTFFSPWVAALLYGLGLGVGFLTFLSVGTYVAVAVGAVASGDPVLGAALCAPFGVARGLTVLLGRRSRGGEDAGQVVDRIEDLGATRTPGAANAAVLALVLAAALAAL